MSNCLEHSSMNTNANVVTSPTMQALSAIHEGSPVTGLPV
jgi:hypothetical protein